MGGFSASGQIFLGRRGKKFAEIRVSSLDAGPGIVYHG